MFEKNIWDILLEIKQKNGVDSFVIEPVDEKRKRETKILYKSDLLFYLQLYAELYPEVKLPDYLHFCIDEAQDLHKADYQIIKKLFPHAVLNLFGDTAQVLHTNCGINNWEKETGISKIYSIIIRTQPDRHPDPWIYKANTVLFEDPASDSLRSTNSKR